MSRLARIRERRDEILSIAARHGAADVRLFGSTARGADGPDSDVDLLVDFDRGRSLLDQVGLEQALGDLLGCRVEVVAVGGISPHLEPAITAGAVPL